jgi:hypothetical protein
MGWRNRRQRHEKLKFKARHFEGENMAALVSEVETSRLLKKYFEVNF